MDNDGNDTFGLNAFTETLGPDPDLADLLGSLNDAYSDVELDLCDSFGTADSYNDYGDNSSGESGSCESDEMDEYIEDMASPVSPTLNRTDPTTFPVSHSQANSRLLETHQSLNAEDPTINLTTPRNSPSSLMQVSPDSRIIGQNCKPSTEVIDQQSITSSPRGPPTTLLLTEDDVGPDGIPYEARHVNIHLLQLLHTLNSTPPAATTSSKPSCPSIRDTLPFKVTFSTEDKPSGSGGCRADIFSDNDRFLIPTTPQRNRSITTRHPENRSITSRTAEKGPPTITNTSNNITPTLARNLTNAITSTNTVPSTNSRSKKRVRPSADSSSLANARSSASNIPNKRFKSLSQSLSTSQQKDNTSSVDQLLPNGLPSAFKKLSNTHDANISLTNQSASINVPDTGKTGTSATLQNSPSQINSNSINILNSPITRSPTLPPSPKLQPFSNNNFLNNQFTPSPSPHQNLNSSNEHQQQQSIEKLPGLRQQLNSSDQELPLNSVKQREQSNVDVTTLYENNLQPKEEPPFEKHLTKKVETELHPVSQGLQTLQEYGDMIQNGGFEEYPIRMLKDRFIPVSPMRKVCDVVRHFNHLCDEYQTFINGFDGLHIDEDDGFGVDEFLDQCCYDDGGGGIQRGGLKKECQDFQMTEAVDQRVQVNDSTINSAKVNSSSEHPHISGKTLEDYQAVLKLRQAISVTNCRTKASVSAQSNSKPVGTTRSGGYYHPGHRPLAFPNGVSDASRGDDDPLGANADADTMDEEEDEGYMCCFDPPSDGKKKGGDDDNGAGPYPICLNV